MPAHLDDLASDFSAIHRIGDVTALSGPVFFRLAFRLGAYAGVIQARALAEQSAGTGAGNDPGTHADTATPPPRPRAAAGSPTRRGTRDDPIPVTPLTVAADPHGLGRFVSFG